MATLYRYDWYITPYVEDSDKSSNKVLKDFTKVLLYMDSSDVKELCRMMALTIVIEGVYYGMLVDFGDKFGVQQLPADYCRTRYYSGTSPVVELNLGFFDAYFSTVQLRMRILKTFPKDVQQAYVLYKQNKLQGDYPGDRTVWYPLDPAVSVCLSLDGNGSNGFPPLVNVIPSIIDLDQAQELDRKKTMQQLLKIVVQKLPLDKNSDLVLDMDEARDLHQNMVEALKKAIGVEVVTTPADVEKIDTKDDNSTTSTDDLEKVERTVYNNAGISYDLFNADGNNALNNSILADEASFRDLPLKFTSFLNRVVSKFNRKNHYTFRAEMLETTQYNYKDLAKLYKEQTQMGLGMLLSQIALGHSQSSILATMTFENEVLHLADLMQPPQTSSTVSKNQVNSGQSTTSNSQSKQTSTTTTTTETKEVGRPEKDDSEKSEKTLQNLESQS